MSYFSKETIDHQQQDLSERHRRRAQDVTLVCKLTHVYGKYHLAMLHRQLAMSEERTTCISPSMPMRYYGTSKGNARGGGGIKKSAYCILIRKEQQKTKFCLKSLEVIKKMSIFAARMRVAYRRDDIKLRNRSLYTKPLVEYLRL